MEELKTWIEKHKQLLRKAVIALLAFIIGAYLVLMIHPVKTVSKDCLLTFSRMQETSDQYVGKTTKEPAIEDLLSLELTKEDRKTQKNWVTLAAFVKKYGKAESFTQEENSYGVQVQLGYGTAVQGINPYTIEFQKQDGAFYLSAIQSFAPQSTRYQSKKNLKLADFTNYQTLDGKKEKGTAVEDVLKTSGLPNSLSLTTIKDKQVLALSYQVTDGLVSLTFEHDQSGQYRLSKKG